MKQKDLLIVIPVYNEEKNIRRVLEALLRPEIMEIADVLAVDDASRDHSGEIVRKRGCNLITHPRRLGYGRALRSGYQYALQRGYRYVIQMDADGQHDPCNIPVIYRRLKETRGESRILYWPPGLWPEARTSRFLRFGNLPSPCSGP